MQRSHIQHAYAAGDVVFGKFALESGEVLRHYSVVLQVMGDALLLAYATSLKEDVTEANPATIFTAEDMKLANMEKAGRWVAEIASVVSRRVVRYEGRVSDSTLSAIQSAFNRARQTRTLSLAMLDYNKVTVASSTKSSGKTSMSKAAFA